MLIPLNFGLFRVGPMFFGHPPLRWRLFLGVDLILVGVHDDLEFVPVHPLVFNGLEHQ